MTYPLDKLAICNDALAYLGELKIDDADLTTPDLTSATGQRGRVCNQFYDVSLQALIEQFGWEVRAAKLQYAPKFEEYEDEFLTSPHDIINITQADPAVVFVKMHGYPDKSHVYIYDINSMEELNNAKYFINRIDDDYFSLVGVNTTNFTAYTYEEKTEVDCTFAPGVLISANLEVFISNESYLTDGSKVVFRVVSGTLPTGVTEGVLYYARNVRAAGGVGTFFSLSEFLDSDILPYVDSGTTGIRKVRATNTDIGFVRRIQPQADIRYSYPLPSDMLFPLYLESRMEFSILRGDLISRDGQALLFYAGKPTDSAGDIDFSGFGASFMEALKLKLAINMAPRLGIGFQTAMKTKEALYQEFQLHFDTAKMFIARHSNKTIDYSGDFTNRHGVYYRDQRRCYRCD
jgi:hypothetical protein